MSIPGTLIVAHARDAVKSPSPRITVVQRSLFYRDAKKDALLTATEGFEPSASGNLPSGQQSVSASTYLTCPHYTTKYSDQGYELITIW
jgi:hypothetical protein